MHRLVFLDSAKHDLEDIAEYIARESQSRPVAVSFIDRLFVRCEKLAAIAGRRGKARHELRSEYRSVTFGNYVIFFRYVQAGSESLLQIVHVLNGRRDIEAFFAQSGDESTDE